jgi:hypothetical protein
MTGRMGQRAVSVSTAELENHLAQHALMCPDAIALRFTP